MDNGMKVKLYLLSSYTRVMRRNRKTVSVSFGCVILNLGCESAVEICIDYDSSRPQSRRAAAFDESIQFCDAFDENISSFFHIGCGTRSSLFW